MGFAHTRALRPAVLQALLLSALLCGISMAGSVCAAAAEARAADCASEALPAECSKAEAASPKALPWVMRPGDVVVNAAVGVERRAPAQRELLFSSPVLGVRRAEPVAPREWLQLGASLGLVRGAVMQSVEPQRVGLGAVSQAVVLLGQGLPLTGSVALQPADGVQLLVEQRAPDGSRIDLRVSVDADAQPGLRRLVVLDGQNAPVPAASLAAQSLLIAAELPLIESVSPQQLLRGQRTELLIRGRDLRGLPQAGRSVSPDTRVRITPPAGVQIDSIAQINEAGTEARVWVRVEPASTSGVRLVQLETASGESSPVPSPVNTFFVADATALQELAPVVGPVLGVTRIDSTPNLGALLSPLLGVTRGPALVSISPAAVSRGQRVRITLTGQGLADAVAVALTPAEGLSIVPASFTAGPVEVSFELDVAAGAAVIPRRISLQFPGASIDAPQLLQVRGAIPEVSAISPNVLVRDGTTQRLQIQGQNLAQVTAAALLPDSGVIIESVEITSTATANLTLRALPASPRGLRVLQLRAPAGDSSSDPNAVNTVRIIDRAEWLTPVVGPAVGVLRSSEVAVPMRLLLGPQLGVQRDRYAGAISPSSVPRGVTVQLVVSGQGLESVTQAQFEPAGGLQLTLSEVAADGTRINLELVVATDASPGPRRLLLSGGSGAIEFAPNSAALVRIQSNAGGGPLALADSYTLQANRPFDVLAGQGVLVNDIDPLNGSLFTVLRTVPANGSLQLRADGGFLYTPSADFAGTDSFEYSASNGAAVGNAARVTLSVTELHDALADSYIARDNQALVIAATAGLLANDRIGAGPAPQIELASQPTRGALTLQPDGGFTYVANSIGEERFSYRLITADTRSIPAEVRIQISSVNDAPMAVDDAYSLSRGGRLDVAAGQGVLRNDSDPDGDALNAQLLTPTPVGALVLALNGGFSFVPPADFVGSTSFVYEARDALGLADSATVTLTVNDIDLPPTPSLAAPADGATVYSAQLAVSGSAQAGSQVQLYLNDLPTGPRVAVSQAGGFAGSLLLPAEGTFRIAADARNPRGTSARTLDRWVSYVTADPQITLSSPSEGALIEQDADVTVAIVDPIGVQRVEYRVDGSLAATVNAAPWSWRWPVAQVADGSRTLEARAFNLAGRSAAASVEVQVQKLPPPAPPVPTPYVGDLLELGPALSFGEQPVRIRGRALERSGAVAVPNALLRLVLEAGGFERRINVATNETGEFEFNFQPAATDAGSYRVSVRHPDQSDPIWQGQFAINRVRLNPSTINLNAARTIPTPVQITLAASAGNGVSNLRIAVVPADQPSGALPPGIQVQVPAPVSLAAGASRTVELTFTGAASAADAGTVVLTAFADDSGTTPRGRVSLSYRLSAPLPALVPQPNSLRAGVRQGGQISVSTELVNQGLLAAEGVQVELLNAAGTGPAPSWAQLSSPGTLGTVPIGARRAIQITASPTESVTDGVYTLRARVSAANASGGDVPVSFAVTQSGEGDVRFQVADIYTATLDDSGQPIPGVEDARIRLQHETIPDLRRDVLTGPDGGVVLTGLPVGRYQWRASALDHADSSGRVQVLPGVQTPVEVFLDFELVSIDWSVTETTIEDEYDIVIGATYRTEVPAPVVLMEPVFVNLPALQVGEEFSGELTISNYGLVRADNLVFTPASSDGLFRFEFQGEVPAQLGARERIRLNYKITALQPMPSAGRQLFDDNPLKDEPPVPLIQLSGSASASASGGTCSSYRNRAVLQYDYECANGARRGGSAGTSWGRTVGSSCGGPGGASSPNCTSGGSCGRDGAGSWGGWSGVPMPGGPPCTPNCKKCCSGGGASGGGGGGGGGGGSGSGGGGSGGSSGGGSASGPGGPGD